MYTIALLIGGLIMFIYGVRQLSKLLETFFSDKARTSIQRYTNNLFSAILIGAIATLILDSSSGTIILTIVLINSQILSFKQAMGIILGANIGTTASSKIIAIGLGAYAIIPLAIGVMAYIFIRQNSVWRNRGLACLYFGMLFFGLYLMQESVVPLRDSQLFHDWIMKLNSPTKGALVGGLMTLIVQSSGATVAMAIVLGKQKLIDLATGLSLMLGAELGTCSNTLIATYKGTRRALKAGIFHLFFNFVCIIAGLITFDTFVKVTEIISTSDNIASQIANGHILFNIVGVAVFIPFVGLFEKLLNYILPENRADSNLNNNLPKTVEYS